ncbi:MAG: sigma-54 dependent transcriptional regulator [Chitinophagaceae bacterium]|nr:sigma-54 dependent transcriptional regulator [Chitinophagaceae bacterium]
MSPAISILLIDDEQQLRQLTGRILKLEGFPVYEAGHLAEARKLLQTQSVDIVLCDVRLPDGNGVDFIPEIKKSNAEIEIVMLTAYGNIPDGIQAIRNGAYDYLVKGNDNDRLIPLLHRLQDQILLRRKLKHLEKRVAKKYSFDSIIGESPVIREVVALARKVASTDSTVLLTGETGTGKEVFAQAIHQAGGRNKQPFVAINCSAFGRDILESELFGHKAGAFTGANKDKKGLMEEAHLGTLFMDEIGEMPLDLQAKLLRVLETGEFIKVGDTKTIKVNIRLIAATHRDLTTEVKEGRFREDLFYRLNVFAIHLPSLRERQSDIPILADHFLLQLSNKTHSLAHTISPAFLQALQQYRWKGNIRELKNVIERAMILAPGDELLVDHLPPELKKTNQAEFSTNLADMEKRHIAHVLTLTKGNKTKAAEQLGIGLTTLYRKIEEYKLDETLSK